MFLGSVRALLCPEALALANRMTEEIKKLCKLSFKRRMDAPTLNTGSDVLKAFG